MLVDAKNVKLELYLEGIQVPIISAQIQEGLRTTPSCTVNIGANRNIAGIVMGTIGHLYYHINGIPYLIFEGFVSGIDIAKTSTSKVVNLFMVGLTGVFDQAWSQKIDFTMESVVSQDFYVNMSAYLTKTPVESDESKSKGVEQSKFKAIATDTDVIGGVTGLIQGWLAPSLAPEELDPNTTIDINQLFEKIFEYFKSLNPYFRRIYNTQRFGDRIYVASNEQAIPMIKAVNFITFINSQRAQMPQTMNLRQFLDVVCNYISYDWIELPAPIVAGASVYSIIIKPQLQYTTPISVNIFYPNQVLDLRYSDSSFKKPTRFMMRSTPLIFGGGSPISLSAIVPKSQIVPGDGITYTHELTVEEKERGIVPVEEGSPKFLDQAYLDNLLDKKAISGDEVDTWKNSTTVESPFKPPEFDTEDDSNDYNNRLIAIANRRFFELRSQSSNVSVIASYSPYRLVGFPCVLLDTDLPNIGGLVAGINSVIAADGSATQTLSVIAGMAYKNPQDYKTISDTSPLIPEYYSAGYYFNSIDEYFYANLDLHTIRQHLSSEKYDEIKGKAEEVKIAEAIKMTVDKYSNANITAFYELEERVMLSRTDHVEMLGSGVHAKVATCLGASEGTPYLKKRQDAILNIVFKGAQNAI